MGRGGRRRRNETEERVAVVYVWLFGGRIAFSATAAAAEHEDEDDEGDEEDGATYCSNNDTNFGCRGVVGGTGGVLGSRETTI